MAGTVVQRPSRPSQSGSAAIVAVLIVCSTLIVLCSGAAAGGNCTSPVTIQAAGDPGPQWLEEVVRHCNCGGPTTDSEHEKALALCRINIVHIRARSYNATCRGITDDSAFLASQCCDYLLDGLLVELPKECTNEEEKQRKEEEEHDRKQKTLLALKIVGGILAPLIAGLAAWLIKRWWKSRH